MVPVVSIEFRQRDLKVHIVTAVYFPHEHDDYDGRLDSNIIETTGTSISTRTTKCAVTKQLE
jgi:hypothetical protein